MPRRHILSAAGALAAALLLAVQAPANAQDAPRQPLRGSIGLQKGSDGLGAPSATGSGQGHSADSLESSGGENADGAPQALGGMGDEAPPAPATPPLGGLGDQSTFPPEEAVTLEEEIGLAQPARAGSEPRQIHSALQPEPHVLDPYVPIGFRIGTFLLFPEVEVGHFRR